MPSTQKWKPSPNQKPMVDHYHQYIRDSRPCMIPVTPILYALYGEPQQDSGIRLIQDNSKRMAFVCAGSIIFFQPFEGGAAAFAQFSQCRAAQITSLVCGGSGIDDQMIVNFLIEKHPVHKYQEYWQHLHAGWSFYHGSRLYYGHKVCKRHKMCLCSITLTLRIHGRI